MRACSSRPCVFCLLSALAFGLGPAWRQARTDALPELKEQAGEMRGRRPSASWLGRWRPATRDLLVMGQLALSLVTLTAAGLFVRAALQSAKADPGFTFDRGIVANVDPSLAGRNAVETQRYYEQALSRVRASSGDPVGELRVAPGVRRVHGIGGSAAGGRAAAEHGASGSKSMSFGGDGAASEVIAGLVDSVSLSIGADYFKTIGLAVTRGREFTMAEEFRSTGARIAIIDETLATKLFGAENPVGQFVQFSKRQSADPTVLEVVGVVGPSRHQLFDHEMRPHLYLPYGQEFRSAMHLHVEDRRRVCRRRSGDAARASGASSARSMPPCPSCLLKRLPMYRDRNLLLWTLRAGANTFLTFGLIALFMSSIGIYGVKAYVVARRTREIGIRLALGATPRNVVAMVLRDGGVLAFVGLGVGLLLSIAAGGAIRHLLFGDARFDAPVVLGAALILAGAALFASWLPARRATRIAATMAMRQ